MLPEQVYILASKFAQVVLDQAHTNIYKNHVIRINQQAQILINSVKDGIKAGVMSVDAQRYAESLHNFAVQYTGLVMQTTPPDTTQLKNLYKEMVQIYRTLAKTYIDPKFDAMKQIRESLYYVGKFGPIDMFSSGTVTPDTALTQAA